MTRPDMLKFMEHWRGAEKIILYVQGVNRCGGSASGHESILNNHLDAMCELLEPEREYNEY